MTGQPTPPRRPGDVSGPVTGAARAPRTPGDASAPARPLGLIAVRYGLPGAVVLAGVLVLILNHSLNGIEGFAMFVGAAGAILLLNVLYRVGVSGDIERDEEAAARDYLDEHGHWPDER
jgi:hypothetical protein